MTLFSPPTNCCCATCFYLGKPESDNFGMLQCAKCRGDSFLLMRLGATNEEDIKQTMGPQNLLRRDLALISTLPEKEAFRQKFQDWCRLITEVHGLDSVNN